MHIDHVSLNVHDRDGSIAFYEEVLGLRMSGRPGPVDEPAFVGSIGLFADRAPGVRHVAFATDCPGQDRVRDELDRRGIPWHAERHRHHHSLYFADPDGLTLEVMVPAE
jgi:catechol 2,3-dioxygenase-like lactoylglutathione lyase family enzyme